jgi:hypothetical protein
MLPASVAIRFLRDSIRYRQVPELAPARIFVAWLSESRSPEVARFVRAAKTVAAGEPEPMIVRLFGPPPARRSYHPGRLWPLWVCATNIVHANSTSRVASEEAKSLSLRRRHPRRKSQDGHDVGGSVGAWETDNAGAILDVERVEDPREEASASTRFAGVRGSRPRTIARPSREGPGVRSSTPLPSFSP